MASEQKLVTIFGGTGNQGGGLARSLLLNKDKTFKVRVITRDPTSDKAQAFAKLGAEVVKADGFNKAEVKKAFEGSWGAFVNTNSNDKILNTPGMPNDYDLGALVIEGANEADVKHVVYSSGPSTCQITKGRIHIDGFETKFHVDMEGRAKNFTSWIPVYAACFMENLNDPDFTMPLGGFPWVKNEEGEYLIHAPLFGGKEDMPWISVEDDFGDIVHGIFLEPEKYDRKPVQATSQMLSFPELAQSFIEATGQKCRYEQMPSWTSIEANGSKCREELRGMFAFTQINNGKVFGEEPNDISVAAALKKAARQVQGNADVSLFTLKDWIRREWHRKSTL